jgi:hypothetical protein
LRRQPETRDLFTSSALIGSIIATVRLNIEHRT